jgi:putative ABC transport system permease protein
VLAFLRRSVREMGQTIVMVTHDPVAASYADRVLFLADGRIVDEMPEPTADRVLERMKAFDRDQLSRRPCRRRPRCADMWRTTYKNLLAHKLRLAMSGLAIVLGVAFVSGTLIFTDTLSRTFNACSPRRPPTSTSHAPPPSSRAWRRRVRDRHLRALPSSSAGSPRSTASRPSRASCRARASTSSTRTERSSTPAVHLASASGWQQERAVSPTTLVDGRRHAVPPSGDRHRRREEAGYQVGDRITLLTPGPRVEAEVVGTFRFGDEGGLAGASLTAFDTDTAQQLLTAPGQFHGISIAAADGVSDAVLKDRVAALVGAEYDVKTAAEQADSLAADLSDSLQFINVFLLVFAGVRLFVGTFIILNTFSMLVAQRTKELALLRALGAKRAQVTRAVLGEALVLGTAGLDRRSRGRLRSRRRPAGAVRLVRRHPGRGARAGAGHRSSGPTSSVSS